MKMKNFIRLGRLPGRFLGAALCTVVLLPVGCTTDSGKGLPDAGGRVALSVSSGIDVFTRAHDDEWERGDAIGIYMLDGETPEAANRKYTTPTADGAFTAAEGHTIYFPIEGKRDFVAYYPYQQLGEGVTTCEVDVSRQSPQNAIDLMGADKVTGKHKDDPRVAFVFVHKLVRLALTIKADGKSLGAEDLKGMTVTLTNQRMRGTYDVVKGGSVVVDGQTAPGSIELLTATDGTTAEGIVLPAADTEGMELVFQLAKGARYTWAVKEAPKSQSFLAGSKYVYAITITNTEVNVTSSVTDWSPGNEGGESGSAQ